MADFVKVIIFSVSSFVILFFIAKILGKKQIAELDFTDYVVGITIGSIAAEWATDVDGPWYHYVIAMAIFGVLSFIITIMAQRITFMKAFLRGKPIIVVDEGKIVYKNLKKSKIDVHDVLGMCRAQGYFNIDDIEYAIFETSGDLSVLPKSKQKPATIGDIISPKLEESSLTNYVIIDGYPNIDILKSLNKDVSWLKQKLNITSKKQFKNIILGIYNENTDEIILHKKKKM